MKQQRKQSVLGGRAETTPAFGRCNGVISARTLRAVVSGVLAAAMAAGLVLGTSVGTAAAQDGERSSVVELPEVEILGRPQRPVEYVLVRSAGKYEVRDLRASFVRDVVRSVEEAPF